MCAPAERCQQVKSSHLSVCLDLGSPTHSAKWLPDPVVGEPDHVIRQLNTRYGGSLGNNGPSLAFGDGQVGLTIIIGTI